MLTEGVLNNGPEDTMYRRDIHVATRDEEERTLVLLNCPASRRSYPPHLVPPAPGWMAGHHFPSFDWKGTWLFTGVDSPQPD